MEIATMQPPVHLTPSQNAALAHAVPLLVGKRGVKPVIGQRQHASQPQTNLVAERARHRRDVVVVDRPRGNGEECPFGGLRVPVLLRDEVGKGCMDKRANDVGFHRRVVLLVGKQTLGLVCYQVMGGVGQGRKVKRLVGELAALGPPVASGCRGEAPLARQIIRPVDEPGVGFGYTREQHGRRNPGQFHGAASNGETHRSATEQLPAAPVEGDHIPRVVSRWEHGPGHVDPALAGRGRVDDTTTGSRHFYLVPDVPAGRLRRIGLACRQPGEWRWGHSKHFAVRRSREQIPIAAPLHIERPATGAFPTADTRQPRSGSRTGKCSDRSQEIAAIHVLPGVSVR